MGRACQPAGWRRPPSSSTPNISLVAVLGDLQNQNGNIIAQARHCLPQSYVVSMGAWKTKPWLRSRRRRGKEWDEESRGEKTEIEDMAMICKKSLTGLWKLINLLQTIRQWQMWLSPRLQDSPWLH